ncbi:thioredoxin family protein [Punctularia strigosozonata HHB-11173 SS5]|uniref:thioredoxin family protein n=1 Tax=Punctularia strigosozonata (strain HHB-11173) TaxID=741275 RepID=UPI0004417314|nr:thioredoxin family protein [Punctularia strigosozonata HHB-11173 SS5]EIN12585.1 thioredoxin family protein [Punctularia strigosozonata HHB-11173 SS5]
MGHPVQLYVYDLSNGLAKALSLQLTGRQIDGIWHTSVVVFGKEIFYGAGISITSPGMSHHGKPLQILDMGETSIDEDTFEEYLNEMREHYTADKYHLLEFNCNSFTNDCVGFLTGGSIPSWIKDLPADFLSTPFGAALRPTIDSMFRRPAQGAAPVSNPAPQAAINASPNPQLASTLLQAFANRATQPSPSGSGTSTPTSSQPYPQQANGNGNISTSTLSAPIHACTNPSSFNSLLATHRAVAAFFTSATCGPCRMIEPTFENLVHEKKQVAFAKIDLGVGMGTQVGSMYGVRVTPTFIFFLDGKKVGEFKGANVSELQSQVDMLIFQAFPPHPHTKLSLPAIEALSLNPILFTQIPAFDALQSNLESFIDASPASFDKAQTKSILTAKLITHLKNRAGNKNYTTPPAMEGLFIGCAVFTTMLARELPIDQLFPLVDLWRLALLDPAVSAWAAALSPGAQDPIEVLSTKAIAAFDLPNSRNYILITLRMLANAFSSPQLARRLLLSRSAASSSAFQGGAADSRSARKRTTALLVPALLHEDAAVRTAAASLAFNVSAWLQKGRVERVRGRTGATEDEEDPEWEVEMVSAVVEALSREDKSEDVVHRLTACLAFLLRLSPVYDEQIAPLMEVFQVREVLNGKLEIVHKPDVKKLIKEVADKLITQ